MKKINQKLWLFLFALLTITACKKDDIVDPIVFEQSKGFYIINEGMFTQGNTSISFYDFNTDELTEDIFQDINQRPLGDVAHSLTFHKGKGYIVVNNSSKIEVVDSASMKSIQTIEGFTSPRTIKFYNDKAYVSDLYSNSIHVLDANTLSKKGSIPVDGSTEDIVVFKDKLLVAVNQSFDESPEKLQGLLVINTKTDAIEKYIPLSDGAVDIEVDGVDNIWVYCTGFWKNNSNGKLHKVNSKNYTVDKTFDFGKLSYFAAPLQLGQSGNTVYFAMAGDPSSYTEYNIFEMNVNSTALPVEPLFSGKDKYVYGFEIDEVRKEIYILDAVESGQRGLLHKVDATTKSIKKSYDVGYFPREIVFKY